MSYRISPFGVMLALTFLGTAANAVAEEQSSQKTHLHPGDMIVSIENTVKGKRIDVVRARVEFVFKSGERRTGYAVLHGLAPGTKGTLDLAQATAKSSLSVVRVEATVDLETGKTSQRVVRDEDVVEEKEIESKESATSGEAETESTRPRIIGDNDIQNLSDVYLTQINAFELRANDARRKKVARQDFGGTGEEHAGIRNRHFSIVANTEGGDRKFLIRPESPPVFVNKNDSKP